MATSSISVILSHLSSSMTLQVLMELTGFYRRLIDKSCLLWVTNSLMIQRSSMRLLQRSKSRRLLSFTPIVLILLSMAERTLRLSPPLKAKEVKWLWSKVSTLRLGGASRKNWIWLLLRFKISSKGTVSCEKSTDSSLLALMLRYLRYCNTCADSADSSILVKKLKERSSHLTGISCRQLTSLKLRWLKSLKQLQLALTLSTFSCFSQIYFNLRSYWWLRSSMFQVQQSYQAVYMRTIERIYWSLNISKIQKEQGETKITIPKLEESIDRYDCINQQSEKMFYFELQECTIQQRKR